MRRNGGYSFSVPDAGSEIIVVESSLHKNEEPGIDPIDAWFLGTH